MSDTAPTTEAPATETAPAQAAETAPTPDVFDDPKVETFDRKYVEKLRQEAASHRTRHAPFEEAFGQYADEDRAAWLDLAKTLATDPAAAAKRFKEIADGLAKQYPGEDTPTAEELAAQAGAEGDPADKPMTRAEVEAFLKEKKDAETQEAAIKAITDEVAAKYPAGTPEHREALWLAANETNGDIPAALAKMEERRQAIVDQYLTGKKAQAGGAHPVTSTGDPSGEAKTPRTFKDARASLNARLAASQA